MINDDVKKAVERLYDLDVKVYDETGSSMGKVFPAGRERTVNKILNKLETDGKHFIRNETTLIGNMIATIRDDKKAAEFKKELSEITKILERYNPVTVLPDTYVSNITSGSKGMFGDGNHKIICIGREYGSGGHEIGYRLAKNLGISYFDKDIIQMAYEHLGQKFTDDYDARGIRKTLLEKGYGKFARLQCSDKLFFAQSKFIEEMAGKEDCIFMGRCADVVLENAGIPRISIFIGAPFEERVKHEMACSGIDRDSAVELIHRMDKTRKTYYNFYTGRKWGHSENYDLCINTACYGIDGSVNMLSKMIEML